MNSQILNILSNYDVYDVLSKLSALNLLPYNQNKAIVFDYLIDLVLQRGKEEYQASNRISKKRLEQVVQLSYDYNRIAIDPAEMPFIQRIRFYGNKWILCGINTDCGYNLQSLVNSLFLRKNNIAPDFLSKARRVLQVILGLSTSIVHTLEYSLDNLGHYERIEIDYPPSNKMSIFQKAITFSYSVLQENLDEQEIEALFTEFGQNGTPDNYTDFNFCRHPFLKTSDNSFICLNPTLLASFAINYILQLSEKYGIRQEIIDMYNNEVWDTCTLNLHSLDHYEINESLLNVKLKNNDYYREKLFSISNGISNCALLVFFIKCTGLKTEKESILTNNPKVINERYNEIVESLPTMADRNRIYTLIICNCIGETVLHGFSAMPDKHLLIRPFELQCISINENGKFIPYFIEAKLRLQFHHTPFSDALDYISYFTANDYSFYTSDDIDMKESYSIIGLGDAVDYINTALKKEDRQLVERLNSPFLADIVVQDSKRSLYRPAVMNNKPEILLRLKHANIWISSQTITRDDEINICFTLVDVISFWLGELHDMLTTIMADSVEIINYLTDDIKEYYHAHESELSLNNLLEIRMDTNIIEIFWSSTAYYQLSKNGCERALIELILKTLFEKDTIRFNNINLDACFSSPLKQRMQILEGETYPYLKPISGTIRSIPHVYEDLILDDIGQYFKSIGTPYGEITSFGKAEVCNKIVTFLYTKLVNLVSEYSSRTLCILAYYDLEVIMFKMMEAQKRYSYDIECYPEKQREIERTINDLNKSSVAIKFFIEYVSSVPSSDNKTINELDYEYILAVCSQIIEWANTGDLFYNNMIDVPISLLKSHRIGMDRSEVKRLTHYNYHASTLRLTQSSNPLKQPFHDPWDSLVSSNDINEAIVEEYGYSFSDLFTCVMSMIAFGNTLETEVKQADITEIIKFIPDVKEETIRQIISDLCNVQRSDYLQPPKPFSKNDVYPWRFNRRLAFIRRPVIRFENNIIWGNRQLFHNLLYLTELIKEGKLAASKGKLKMLMSKMANKLGNDFNTAVAQRIESFGFSMVFTKVNKINHNKIESKPGYALGDIDVLLINPQKHKIVVIEVKEFSFSKTPYEIHREYLKLFCDTDKEICYITKHKRRVQWIKEHISDLILHYGLDDGKWEVSDALIVNQPIVCNEFYHRNQRILLYSELSSQIINDL